MTQKIMPSLWFNNNAEEAVQFYTSLFDGAKIINTARYNKAAAEMSHMPEGSVMTIEFELAGQKFLALNGGPAFQFTEAISFIVNCDSQEEVDKYWDALSRDGQEVQCGWLKDKFGLSWQITPTEMLKYIGGPDAEGRERAMQAMGTMKKIDLAEIKKAYEG